MRYTLWRSVKGVHGGRLQESENSSESIETPSFRLPWPMHLKSVLVRTIAHKFKRSIMTNFYFYCSGPKWEGRDKLKTGHGYSDTASSHPSTLISPKFFTAIQRLAGDLYYYIPPYIFPCPLFGKNWHHETRHYRNASIFRGGPQPVRNNWMVLWYHLCYLWVYSMVCINIFSSIIHA